MNVPTESVDLTTWIQKSRVLIRYMVECVVWF